MDEKLQISLAAARVNAELTQAEVSSILKVSKNTLVNWERGYTEPSISQFKKLCELYKISGDHIFLPVKSSLV